MQAKPTRPSAENYIDDILYAVRSAAGPNRPPPPADGVADQQLAEQSGW